MITNKSKDLAISDWTSGRNAERQGEEKVVFCGLLKGEEKARGEIEIGFGCLLLAVCEHFIRRISPGYLINQN